MKSPPPVAATEAPTSPSHSTPSLPQLAPSPSSVDPAEEGPLTRYAPVSISYASTTPMLADKHYSGDEEGKVPSGRPAARSSAMRMMSSNIVLTMNVLEIDTKCDVFMDYAKEHFTQENVVFWREIKLFKENFPKASSTENRESARMIFKRFFSEESPDKINVTYSTLTNIQGLIEKEISDDVFDEALEYILTLTSHGILRDFMLSLEMCKDSEIKVIGMIPGVLGEIYLKGEANLGRNFRKVFGRNKKILEDMTTLMIQACSTFCCNIFMVEELEAFIDKCRDLKMTMPEIYSFPAVVADCLIFDELRENEATAWINGLRLFQGKLSCVIDGRKSPEVAESPRSQTYSYCSFFACCSGPYE